MAVEAIERLQLKVLKAAVPLLMSTGELPRPRRTVHR